jgi:hypothetical protein
LLTLDLEFSAFNSVRDLHSGGYSIFGIDIDRKHTLKWLFPQEKATLHGTLEVYVYSGNALRPAIENSHRHSEQAARVA